MKYDKTELNIFAQNLYDQKMQEGKHGHYETMFHVIHKCIERVNPTPSQQEERKPLPEAQIIQIRKNLPFQYDRPWADIIAFSRQIEAAHNIKERP